MFKLNKGAEYAIQGMLFMAERPGKGCSYIWEIAKAKDMPKAYLAKIFQTLSGKGLVKSSRGRDGGFVLARPSRSITLLEIIEAVEGPVCINDCIEKRGWCEKEADCALFLVLAECHDRFIEVLGGKSLESLAMKTRVESNESARPAPLRGTH
ncbi:MAG: Rrf2 family transcriptional regulator, partial [Thermodesulfobacteriota bacterium]